MDSLAMSRMFGGKSFPSESWRRGSDSVSVGKPEVLYFLFPLDLAFFSLEASGTFSVPIVLKFLNSLLWGGVMFISPGWCLPSVKFLSLRSGKFPSVFFSWRFSFFAFSLLFLFYFRIWLAWLDSWAALIFAPFPAFSLMCFGSAERFTSACCSNLGCLVFFLLVCF